MDSATEGSAHAPPGAEDVPEHDASAAEAVAPPESGSTAEPPADVTTTTRPDPVAERAAYFSERLELGGPAAWMLALLFDPKHYRRVAALDPKEVEPLLAHYVERGIVEELSPSALFDPDHVRRELDGEGIAASTPSVLLWLERGLGRMPANAWFDEEHYRLRHPDVAAADADPFTHFVSVGRDEGRTPCAALAEVLETLVTHFPALRATVCELIESVPASGLGRFASGQDTAELRRLFMPALYRPALALGETIPDEALLAHFLTRGWRDGRRPSVLFHESWYRALVASREDIEPIDERNPYLHWFYLGRPAGLVPTPLFEPWHYLEMHADLRAAYTRAPFEHYLCNGIREHGRSMSSCFESAYYKRVAGPLVHPEPLVDYVVRGQHAALAPIEGLDLEAFASPDPWQSSPAEEAAIAVHRKLRRLDQGPLAEVIARTERLEPLIVRPYGPRKVRMPPALHPEAALALEARAVSEALPRRRYESVVLMPHCRMAGSARIAGALVETLARLGDPSEVLVVTTDLSVFERAEWFPADVDVFDLCVHLDGAPVERRMRALLDLVRGLRPRRLFNVNSNLGWHLTTHYGRQLSEWMSLYVYLFCWDLDFKGNKGGYPIQWFMPTFDHCSGVLTDSAALREELVERYAPSPALAERIVTLYTPATDTAVDYARALAERAAHGGRRRVFWCGRFDRQKRIDLLLAIAEALPETEFLVWGKRVLNDGPNLLASTPENVRLMGSYAHIDDVPIASCDCFLYTAGWDGVPTVLIEVGSRGVPVVASEVGGVGELIDTETGWPVGDTEDVGAYVRAVEEVLSDPAAALERARRLRERTLALCARERYEATLGAVLERERPSDRGASRVYDALPAAAVGDHVFDLSAVLTAHGEGALAAVSYRSFETACRDAERNGLTVERIVVLDRADAQTRRVFDGVQSGGTRLVETDLGDQGAVRNHAARLARGEFLAFLDGDDLWGDNWLTSACRFLRSAAPNVIAHPEFNRFFGGVSSVFVHLDQEDPAFRLDFLRHSNYWDALAMARRETHLAFPYCRRRIREGFAFEDWHWNCETIAGGQLHKVVPDTIHFKRRRQSSQTTQASGNRSVMPLTALTDFADPLAAPR